MPRWRCTGAALDGGSGGACRRRYLQVKTRTDVCLSGDAINDDKVAYHVHKHVCDLDAQK